MVLERKAGAAAGPEPPAAARTWSACGWRWPPTTPSARSSAATRWSPTTDDELVTSAEAARAAGRVSVRFRDDRVQARIEDE